MRSSSESWQSLVSLDLLTAASWGLPRQDAMVDYYEILKVSRNASQDVIKRAYRKQALKWHPDKNPENREHAERRFKEVVEAYEVLSDEEKRKAYDKSGKHGRKATKPAAPPEDPEIPAFGFAYPSPYEMFWEIFGKEESIPDLFDYVDVFFEPFTHKSSCHSHSTFGIPKSRYEEPFSFNYPNNYNDFEHFMDQPSFHSSGRFGTDNTRQDDAFTFTIPENDDDFDAYIRNDYFFDIPENAWDFDPFIGQSSFNFHSGYGAHRPRHRNVFSYNVPDNAGDFDSYMAQPSFNFQNRFGTGSTRHRNPFFNVPENADFNSSFDNLGGSGDFSLGVYVY